MLTKIVTASLWGIEADPVTVETDLQPGLPVLNIVGLADITIKEAKERIRAAILNVGYSFPAKRITVNLSPASKRKEGSHFDLPIALGILMSQIIKNENKKEGMTSCGVIGELSLDGAVKPVKGALPLVLGMRGMGIKKLILPMDNLGEVSMVKGIGLYPVKDLKEAFFGYTGIKPLEKFYGIKEEIKTSERQGGDYEEVMGQESVKRAITVAVSGNHGILLMGSPGAGKTMMAQRIPSIMPDMDPEEILEVSKIYSAAGKLSKEMPVITERPFVAPYATITKAALIGGGVRPRPGEISFAHKGVLFLDEFGEFDHKILNLLRNPIEEGKIGFVRNGRRAEFPCKFMLVAASNPCKCGYLGDSTHTCTCTPGEVERYRSKFTGPLIDRIDMHIKIFPVPFASVKHTEDGLSSEEMKKIVQAARKIQKERQGNILNGQLSAKKMDQYCKLEPEGGSFMEQAYESLSLSMRSYGKIIKVARTIADIGGSEEIKIMHLAEALRYRNLTELYRKEIYGNRDI